MIGDQLLAGRLYCRCANDWCGGLGGDAMQTDSALMGRGKLDRGGLQHGRPAGVRQPQLIGLFVGAEQTSRQHDEAGDDNARQEPGC